LPGERVERRLTAILAADIVGYSRLMGEDEEGTLAQLKAHRRALVDPKINEHRGRIVKTTGDGMLVEFASVIDAVHCSVEIQLGMVGRNEAVPPERRIEFRVGINVGDIIIEGDDIFGEGVNVAARLEGLAEPGGICVSGRVQEDVEGKLEVAFEDIGDQHLKNIARPVRVFRVRLGAAAAAPRPALGLPDKPSIAVLPFDNMSGDPEQAYLADGIVEAITAALSRIRSFFVIARNSAFTYKGRAANVRDIGRELGVAYVLEGSVQKAGNRIRIIVQLIETEGGAHVWAGRHDGTLDDIFDFQDRITEQVAGALQPSIRIAEIERSRRKRPQDLGAYDYAMRAMPHVWALEKEESAKALELLEQALALDPRYPLALSLAGWCHAQRSVYGWGDIAESQALARGLAEKAAELSADDPLILAVLGAVHTFLRNYGTARVLLERAVGLDPNAAWAWSRLGWLDNYSDQPEAAREKFERAMRLSPFDPMNFNNYVGMASSHELLQEYDQAVALYRRALEERPHAMWIYRNLASSLAGAGRMGEAKEAYAQMMRAYPAMTAAKFRQAMVFSSAALDVWLRTSESWACRTDTGPRIGGGATGGAMARIFQNILETVGNTPVVRINRLAPSGVNLFVKIEAFNPLGSVKDRLALGVIEEAERTGELKPGQTVIEATSGNTGIGLAMVCAQKGYPLVVTMAETFSVERRKLMRFLGAKVVLTPAAQRGTGMVTKAVELARANGWFLTRQFENEANPDMHSRTPAARSRALRGCWRRNVRRPGSSSASRRTRRCSAAARRKSAIRTAPPRRVTRPSSRIRCRAGPPTSSPS
jgi:adenylate cyclase